MAGRTPSGKMGRKVFLWLLLITCLGIPACTSPKGQEKESASRHSAETNLLAELLIKAPIDWKPTGSSNPISREQWWTLFEDDSLNHLEQLALDHNQQLAEAGSRREQARSLLGVARSDQWPRLNATPSLTRQRTSPHAFDRGKEIGVPHTYTSYVLSMESSWELDVWGRVRQQVRAARARAQAADDDYRAARLSLQADVALIYFHLIASVQDQQLLTKTISAYEKSLTLVRERKRVGIVSDLDVAQAETQLRSAQSQAPALQLQQQKLQSALAVLCGSVPSTFATPSTPGFISIPPAIPTVVRSEWLEHRPDIAAAARRVEAANADIGVAHAAYYPRLTLKGLAGVQSIDAGSLLAWPSRIWSLGPSLDMPLFTAGRTRSLVSASKHAYDATVAHYRQTVLSAFQEVEDQLTAQTLLKEQEQSETGALASSMKALTIAENRYRTGMLTFLEVATAQTLALGHERTLVQIRAEKHLAAIGLIRSLAASW